MMKIKWVELKEDDPIFKGGFVISYPNIRKLKKVIKNEIIKSRSPMIINNKKLNASPDK